MALPSYVVSIQFGADSSYIDVSQYVHDLVISRGISRVLEDYSAGTLSVTFVNNNRVFDPLNTSSPLWDSTNGYTRVQPGGKIRVTANGVRRFTGYVRDWTFSYDDAGFNGVATLQALDGMYYFGQATLDGNDAWKVEASADRIQTIVLAEYGSTANVAGVSGGQTLLGYDNLTAGESYLTYMQQVARSEPADLYANASGIMVFEDRSFVDYQWLNTYRQNLIAYPNQATADTTNTSLTGGTGLGNGWVYGWRPAPSSITPIYGGTVNRADATATGVSRDFWYQDVNQQRINPSGTATKYVFSVWLRGAGLTGAGVTGGFQLLDSTANSVGGTSISVSAASSATWVQLAGTVTATSGTVAGFYFSVSAPGTAVTYDFFGNGWQVEQGTALSDYFDGNLNPYVDTASTRYRTAWAGDIYASASGMLISNATATTASTYLTFADANSQGPAYGNGTALPFMDLQVVYGSDNLYNKVQIIGSNASAISEDTASQGLYGLYSYSQTDNLTTAPYRPAQIAADLLASWRLPEYRAQQITVPLEALTYAQQNLVLGIELRDVLRVCFQPSATGSIVDKYYQVLGLDVQTDTERDRLILRLGSLDQLAIRLDSNLLSILNTDTLG